MGRFGMSRRIRAGGVTALAVAVSLACLSACTPADEPVTALRNRDGHPTLIAVACEGVVIDSVSVSGQGSTVNGTWEPGPGWAVGGYGERLRGELRLLGPSPQMKVVEAGLTEFTPGTEYTVAAYGDPNAIPISFTLEEIAALQPGRVLVGFRGPGNKRRAVSESAFLKEARKSC